MRRSGAIHAMAWALWLMAVMILLSLNRNPCYIGLVLLWVAVVTGSASLGQPLAPPLLSLWRFGLVVIPTAALFNGLSVHVGATVLLTLPPTLPLIGGPVTLEAVAYGAVNGLAITDPPGGLYASHPCADRPRSHWVDPTRLLPGRRGGNHCPDLCTVDPAPMASHS